MSFFAKIGVSRHVRPAPGRRAARPAVAARPWPESLEPRTLLATAYVANTNDAGAGSLRQAIIDANNHPGFDRIDFSQLPGTGVRTIDLLGPLPAVTGGVVIDGSTAPGYAGSPLVELRGDLAGPGVDGLVIASSSVTVRALAVNGFSGAGIVLQQGSGISLVGNAVGTDATGALARPNGGPGVDVRPGASAPFIGRAQDWLGVQNLAASAQVTTAANPHAISAADLNGDGRPDLVTANFVGNVSVGLNNGNGFAPTVNYPTGGDLTVGVALADLNGDGHLDIATANRNSNNASVLLNNGDGTFGAPRTFSTGSWPLSVNAADFDGDGDLDLVAVNSTSFSVSILLNDGPAGFSAPTNYAVGDTPYESTVADFNGDGRPDVAVHNTNGHSVSVLINLGGGVFAPRVDYPVGSTPHSITSGDFDGDGRPDIASADRGSGTVSVLRNNGDGTFAAAVAVPVPNVMDITAVDLNGDGKLDLLTADFDSNASTALLGDGNGGFKVGDRWDAPGNPRAVASADFNGDGRPDVAVALFSQASARVYMNLGQSASGGNLIAANQGDGVRLNGPGAVVSANTIGGSGLGNGGNGVWIGPDARGSVVGTAGAGNQIVGNGGAGIAVTGALSVGHSLRFNSFEGHAVGIDLGADGPTPNDTGDADTGPNGLQNAPLIASVSPGATTRVVGSIHSNPSATLTIDVYTSAAVAQGRRYLGTFVVTTDGAGDAAFDVTLNAATAAGEAVTATATAPDGGTSEFSAVATVADPNRAPVAALTGPPVAVPGLPMRFPIAASDPDAGDPAAGFTYVVNFGDGSPPRTVPATPGNGAGVVLVHAYGQTGTFVVTLTAADRHGAVGEPATLSVSVRTAALVADPLDPGRTLLAVGGTDGDDTIQIKPGREDGEVKVVARDDECLIFYRHTFDPVIHRIAVYGLGGDDTLTVHPGITIPAYLFGGDGDDRLRGGGGPTVMAGGRGADLLVGGKGRDVLIGGTGADRLVGNGGDDILVAGSTAHDADDAALAAVLAEWVSSRPYLDRARNLRGDAANPSFGDRANGGFFLAADGTHGRAVTVFDDGERDILTGGQGLDWFLAAFDAATREGRDHPTDLHAAEFADDLDFINGD